MASARIAQLTAPAVEDLLYSCLLAEPQARFERVEECCSDHPALADELRRQFERLTRLGLLSEVGGDPGAFGGERFATPTSLGPFRVDGLLGRGGMGVVYRGVQPSLGDRPVALKVLLPERLGDRQSEARFVREGLLAARLQHPNLCPVLDVGKEDGLVYLAMPLIEGETLMSLIDRQGLGGGHGPVELPGHKGEAPWRRVVSMGVTLAHALHSAHSCRLVHRDIKPGNIMVRPDGDPVVLDFGLARDLANDDVRLTGTLDVIGTPAYMAPEQAESSGRAADARTDVYSLAATLYECLTLRLPHRAASRCDLLRRIASEPATALRRHDPNLSRDLEVVLAAALETAPDRRYETALAFADDLVHVLEGETIIARPSGPLRRAQRWILRNRPAAALIATLIALVLITGVGVAWLTTLSSDLQEVGDQREHALVIADGQMHFAEHRYGDALEAALAGHRHTPLSPESVGLMAQSLGRWRQIARFRAQGRPKHYTSSPDGELLAFGVRGGVDAYHVDDPLREPVHIQGALAVASRFTRDGDLIAYLRNGSVSRTGMDGRVRWSTAAPPGTGNIVRGPIPALELQEFDGELLVLVGTRDGCVRVLDAVDGQEIDRVEVASGTVHLIRAFPASDNYLIAVRTGHAQSSVFGLSTSEGVPHLLHVTSGSLVHRLNTGASGIYTSFAAASGEVDVGMFATEPLDPSVLDTLDELMKRAAGGSENGRQRIRAIRVRRGQIALAIQNRVIVIDPFEDELIELEHHSDVSVVAFTDDENALVTATRDGVVTRWSLRPGRVDEVLLQASGFEVTGLKITENGRVFESGSDGAMVVLESRAGPFARVRLGYGSVIPTPAWLADGSLLVTVPIKSHVDRIDAATGRRIARFHTGTTAFFAPGASAQPLLWRTDGKTSMFATLDPVTGQGTQPVEFPDARDTLKRQAGSASRDGNAFALNRLDSEDNMYSSRVTLFRRTAADASWELAWDAEFDDYLVKRPCILEDGRVALSCEDGSLRITDGDQTETIFSYGSRGVALLASHPDGKSMVVGLQSGELVRMALDGQSSLEWDGHAADLAALVISNDGSLTASGDSTGEVALWSSVDGRLVSRWRAHPNCIKGLAFSVDGTKLATSSYDGILAVWPTDPEEVVRLAKERRCQVVDIDRP